MSCVFKFQWGETILSLTPDRRHRRARRQALCAWPRGDLVYSSYGSWFPHRPTSGHGAHRVVYSMDLTSVGIRALVQPFAGSTPPHDRLGRDKLLCARTLFRYMGLGPPYWHRFGGATNGPNWLSVAPMVPSACVPRVVPENAPRPSPTSVLPYAQRSAGTQKLFAQFVVPVHAYRGATPLF